ncbi:MAG: KEOPS complex subunit Cgi121 [Methanobacteriaceae archaeon]
MVSEIRTPIQFAGFQACIKNVPQVLNRIEGLACQGTIQLLQAPGLAGEKHLLHSIHQALLAFQRNENFSHDLGLEICLRVSAQRQISRAIQLLGIKEGKQELCAVMVGCPEDTLPQLENILGPRDSTVLKPDPERLKQFYKISDLELHAHRNVERVLIERTTLLNLEK